MEISHIFYLSGIIFFIFFSSLMLFAVYQIYMATRVVKTAMNSAKRAAVLATTARFAVKSALLRTIISLLEGGEEK